MKLATWNVNGIRARQAQVQQWMECERPDVVCLQEIKATSDQVPAALFETEGYWYYWHGGHWFVGSSYRGPWTYVVVERLPRPILAVPVQYYKIPPGHAKKLQGGPPPGHIKGGGKGPS